MEEPMGSQRYVSNLLTHFVGRQKTSDSERYELLKMIIRSGWLLSSAMVGTIEQELPARIQQIYFGHPLNIENVDLNQAFIADVVCFTDIPQSDLALHIMKYSRFGLSFSKKFLLGKGVNPVFYVSQDSVDPSEGGKLLEQVFRKGLQTHIDLDQWFKAGIENRSGEVSQVWLNRFLLKHIFCFLKFWKHTNDDLDDKNFYMEREWRVYGGFRFDLLDVEKVILPKEYARRIREDIPGYQNEIVFADGQDR
jgi:hypothetical protein